MVLDVYSYSDLHLWTNVSLQLVLGLPLEVRFAPWKIAAVYLLGVALGERP